MSAQFVFDPNRCTGCQACVVGCGMEHGALRRSSAGKGTAPPQSIPWRKVHTFNAFRHPDLPVFHLSLACHHCADPACLRHCPANAYTQDPLTGAVTVDPLRCMGCRYCTWACPFDAPRFNPERGVIEKCTFCRERLQEGREPACVARCPVEALGLEHRSESPEPTPPSGSKPAGTKASPFPLLPATELAPSIRFMPLRRPLPGPLPASPLNQFLDQVLKIPEAKITLKGEWSLVLFTLTLMTLSAWMAGSLAGGPAVRPLPFLLAGSLVLALSTWHLGRPQRAWRALLHLRTSWLSREILLTGAFLGLSCVHLLILPSFALWGVPVLGWLSAGAGFTGLLAIDRLYRVALGSGGRSLHSGATLLGGHYLLGLLAGLPLLAWGAGLFKASLYLHRKIHFAQQGRNPHRAWSALRFLLGFPLPLLLYPEHPALAAAGALLGDLVDRCEFYQELDVPTPEGGIHRALEDRLGAGIGGGRTQA